MKRSILCCLAILVCGAAFGAVGQETPQVVQPDGASYSAAMRTALDEAIRALERALQNTDLASQRSVGQGGWSLTDAAAYTAGTLERLGYNAVVVRVGAGTSGERVWVLVGLELFGETVWVPVEPLPGTSGRQSRLGVVARADGAGLRFDGQYVSFDSVVELPPNTPPIAIIRPPTRIREQQAAAWFGHTSADPDGDVVLYQWTFPGAATVTTISSSVWFTFDAIGTYTVGLTVTDIRGAQGSTSLAIDVVEENDCGCP